MKANFLELKRQRNEAISAAESILDVAQAEGRQITPDENQRVDAHMEAAQKLSMEIRKVESLTTVRPDHLMPGGGLSTGRTSHVRTAPAQRPMSAEYTEAFVAFLRSGGSHGAMALGEGFDPMFHGYALPALPGMQGALYGGSSSAGGYAVPVPPIPRLCRWQYQTWASVAWRE